MLMIYIRQLIIKVPVFHSLEIFDLLLNFFFFLFFIII